MEKLVKAGHLRRYFKEAGHIEELGSTTNRIAAEAATSSKPRPVINYILGSPSDDQCQLKGQQKKILGSAIVKAKVNAIHTEGGHEETRPIDNLISFPHVNPNRIIMPYYDALLHTLCISGFDVHRVLVDPGSTAALSPSTIRGFP